MISRSRLYSQKPKDHIPKWQIIYTHYNEHYKLHTKEKNVQMYMYNQCDECNKHENLDCTYKYHNMYHNTDTHSKRTSIHIS